MNTDKKLFINSNIKYLRKLNNKKQIELADIFNKSITTISYWESGDREPTAVDLGNIADYFGITVNELLFKDLRFEKTEEQITIETIKENIKRIANDIINETNKKSLIDMVDYFHNLTQKENNENK